MTERTLGVIGLGKLGSCVAAVLATTNNVIGFDVNPVPLLAISAGRAPVDEPGLDVLIEQAGSRLRVVDDVAEVAASCTTVFVVVPTPSASTGEFSNRYVIDAVSAFGAALPADGPHVTVVISSTVMPGACAGPIRLALERTSRRRVGDGLSLVYSPEFIALGSVIRDLTHPDVILIGCDDGGGPDVADIVAGRIDRAAQPPAVHQMGLTEAEVAKLSLNVALSVKIAYATEVALLTQRLGVDGAKVLAAVGDDSRIGRKFLALGGPASGPCLPRDLVAFARTADLIGTTARLAVAARITFDRQAIELARLALMLSGKNIPTVAILGMAYKPGSAIIDESTGVRVARLLHGTVLADGTVIKATIVCHDPKAQLREVTTVDDPQQAINVADVVIVATPWPEYTTLDYGDVPVLDVWGVVDARNVHRFGVG